jgi:hygromycin-B 7''-O-kinase
VRIAAKAGAIFCRQHASDKISDVSDFFLPAAIDWANWGALFTDEDRWRPVIDRVWANDDTLPAAGRVAEPHRVVAGFPGTCAVFIVDEAAVIKFFPPMVANDFAREVASYHTLGDRVPHLPLLLSHGRYQDRIEWPYVVVSCLPGQAWREVGTRLSAMQAEGLVAELGRMARLTHEIALPPTGSWPAAGAWATLVASRLARAGDDLRRGTALQNGLIEEIESLLATTSWFDQRPCLLHSDLTEDHLLVTERDGEWSVTGLIDWADAEVGDPIYDWVAAWFSICRRDPRLFGAFLSGYGARESWDGDSLNRLIALTFLHRFGATIISDSLPPVEQRAIGTLEQLASALFAGIS